jgi:acetyl esterase/lipase
MSKSGKPGRFGRWTFKTAASCHFMKTHVLRSIVVLSLLSGFGVWSGLAQNSSRDADSVPEGRYKQQVFTTNQFLGKLVYCPQVSDPKTDKPMDLTLNMFLPPKEDTHTKRPLIVFIHGGGFTAGDMGNERSAWGVTRARLGYVCVSISYRLSKPEDSRPLKLARAMEDTQKAIQWLREHAAQYRIDPDRIALEGCSAGGYTSLSVAFEQVNGKFDPGIRAVGDMWGGLETNKMQAGGPAVCIIHGTVDVLVPIALAVNIRDRAAEIGIPCEYHPFEGYGHELKDPNGRNRPAELSLPILTRFYAKYLAKVE